MRGAIPPRPQYVSMAWCLVKQRESFTFTLEELALDIHYYNVTLTVDTNTPYNCVR